ncbi:hypothetical protein [Microbispora catharanthi]|uniref:Uncharacterized protein n=1 Tax=Microbispora catharanthi TaxID=1712871 RepID=A0A5N6B4F3_9ACTN|nr:hypothetical protein [Microbispora catharanthi]KAB8175090.1 hypothetical protein FH610_039925 [Microbispora catharanthi]
MADDLVRLATSPTRFPLRVTFVGWALMAAVLSWVAAFFAGLLVSFSLELHECGLDPLTEYETEKCAPVSQWASVTVYAWIASPLVWLLAGLFLWLAPRRLVRIRQLAAWAMPALPVFVIAAQVLVSLLYGPLPA